MSIKIHNDTKSESLVFTCVAFPFQGEVLQFFSLYFTVHSKLRLSCFTDKIVQFRQNRFSKWHFKKLNSPFLIDQGTGAVILIFKNKGYSAVQLFFILICASDALWNTSSFKIKDRHFSPPPIYLCNFSIFQIYARPPALVDTKEKPIKKSII